MEISAIVGSVEAAKRGKAENEEGGPMTEENEDQRTAAPADADHASKRKNKKKPAIVAGTVAVVLVLAGAGFWVWHEQPSFCNAICHSPMDNYVESYSSGDAGMLVTQHAEAVRIASTATIRLSPNSLPRCARGWPMTIP